MMKNHTVLFVDDEENILSSLKRGLMGEPYLCKFASSGQLALKLFEEYDISVIVTDMRMPKMNGLELLQIVKEKYPDTVKIVLTGYIHLPQILATINQVEVFKFVTKPWDMENELIPILKQAVEYFEFLQEKKKAKESLEKRFISYQNILNSVTTKTKKIEQNEQYLRSVNEAYISEMKRAIDEHDDVLAKLCFNIFSLFCRRPIGKIHNSNEQATIENFKKHITQFIADCSYEQFIDVTWDIEEDAILNSAHLVSYQIIVSTLDVIVKLLRVDQIDLIFSKNQESAFYQNVCIIKVGLGEEGTMNNHLHCAVRLINKIAKEENLLLDEFKDGIAIKI